MTQPQAYQPPAPKSWPEAPALALPKGVAVLGVDEDLEDEATWRQLIAAHIATQTLSLQRTEWYVRSVRVHVMVWFWLTIVGAIIAGIVIGVAANEADVSSSSYR